LSWEGMLATLRYFLAMPCDVLEVSNTSVSKETQNSRPWPAA